MEKIEKTYKYFDLANFDVAQEKVTVEYNAPVTLDEAMQRIGNDQGKILKALDGALKREALSAAKKATLSKGVPRGLVFSVIRPFRAMPPWESIVDRKEQTKQLLAMLRQSPAMVEAIRKAAELAIDTEDEDNVDPDDD